MNREKLHFYQSLTHFLGKVLGEGFEIILYTLEAKNYRVAAVENNHISGCQLNSPITDCLLELIKSQQHLTKECVVSCTLQMINGHVLKSASFFIKDSYNHLEGLLCINQDTRRYEQLSTEILALAGLIQSNSTQPSLIEPNEVVEIFAESIEDVVHSIISPEFLEQNISLTKDLKLDTIRQLNDKGIFQIKGAVAKVPHLLKISEPSVYRHFKIVKH